MPTMLSIRRSPLLLLAYLTASCLPSAFDEAGSDNESGNDPSTACDASADVCDEDGGTGDAAADPPDARADGAADPDPPPPPDAGTPPPSQEPDASPAPPDAGPPPPDDDEDDAKADWPPPQLNAPPPGDQCVFIQFCDFSNHVAGTVCRLFPGCGFTKSTRDECTEEVSFECGRPVSPFFLCDLASERCITP